MSGTESHHLLCHRCGAMLTPGDGSFYFIKIEAFADPTPPDLSASELSERDLLREIDDLIDEVNEFTEQELMDQVYRRLTILLCRPCYDAWIANPAG